VSVTAAQASSERGHRARWTVSAWATGATVPTAAVKLQVTPAGTGTPTFSFGCGKADGTASCDLGAVDPQSAHRQLQAQLTVPVTASAVKSVSLTVTGTAAHLIKAAKASVAVRITAPPASATRQPAPATQPAPAAAPQPLPPPPLPPITVTSPLPVGSLPGIPAAPGNLPANPPGNPPADGIPPAVPAPTQGQSGNAAGLFPTLTPKPTGEAGARGVADTSALPEGASVVGAQLAGLAALALALVFALTRLSIRRPAKQGAQATPGSGPVTQPGAEGNRDEPGA
jgi:hypothetical protein